MPTCLATVRYQTNLLNAILTFGVLNSRKRKRINKKVKYFAKIHGAENRSAVNWKYFGFIFI